MASLRYGQIVLVNASDGRGNAKVRPVVIVTPTDEIVEGADVLAVCVSTQVEYPIPPEHVELPWSRPRHPRTGLNKPNVAKCNWTVSFPIADVDRVLGHVPSAQMIEIIKNLARGMAGDDPGFAAGE